ncbi:3-oxoacyl-[acyl-carrier-protein] synthase III C-terminal domain-containing protein [Paenibacillus sp. 598K]|uniref:3-oxoacyl-[acyl-carrier-protein] synthase III C-terminal domain-containing protein n=1 Tax=Paenibacillus sp. 598K TaxID=1117987 RepID=UPI0021A9CA0C|nr:3-oxoacyl-[acyl-carrier-protein] synthase III C-terminal domain-containing protein [Paenibacillus sp. 598K]
MNSTKRYDERPVYITSIGAFLPGEPVGNEEMEDYLGRIGGKPSRTKSRILKENGIRTRYYAIDKSQNTVYSNTDMAARAIHETIGRSSVQHADIDYLATATTHSELIIPGFASMVQAAARLPVMEIANLHGVCGSGVAAIRSAYLQVKAGGKQHALACASEFPSRIFKSSRYEDQQIWKDSGKIPFDTDFLRFMLSDGAGAMLLQRQPARRGLSLRIEWIDIRSYASDYDTCMYAGANKTMDGHMDKSWLDYPTYREAADAGAINMKQDIRLVNEMPKLGVRDFFALVDEGKLDPADISWMACHYSSHFFRSEVFRLLELGGASIPEEKWFTNLYSKGNTGSASIFIMLEELLAGGKLSRGERILCMVPESGRFLTTFMYLTVVDADDHAELPVECETMPHAAASAMNAASTAGTSAASQDAADLASDPGSSANIATPDAPIGSDAASANRGATTDAHPDPDAAAVSLPDQPLHAGPRAQTLPPLEAPLLREPAAPELRYDASNSLQHWLVRQLVQVWIDFEKTLNRVPIIDKLNRGRFTLEDYLRLLYNIRQQVVDGSQWIARAASNISIDRIDLRSAFISHASDEHKDYQILERNYLAVGGSAKRINSGEKNIGSEALSAYMFHRASRENPFDLLGAMWIIEGLGCRMARYWGEQIQAQLQLPDEHVSFLLYHSESDVNHFERLETGIQSEMLTEEIARRIVKTAKVTARLYVLQLEELDND